MPRWLFLLLLSALVTACGDSAPVAEDVVDDAFSCPHQATVWEASGDCPALDGVVFDVVAEGCRVELSPRDGGSAMRGDFTDPASFTLSGGDAPCSGAWRGLTADLVCQVDGATCTVTLEPPCAESSGAWLVTDGMCFPLDAHVDITQGADCEVTLSGVEVGDAHLNGPSLTFESMAHGSCTAALRDGVIQGACLDGCEFVWKKLQ
jgi:hypothetical protein